MATNQIATLGVKVDPRGAVQGAHKAKRAITSIGKTASNVKKRILSMQGALLGLGAGALIKSVISTASAVESLKVRLKFLTGSTEDAAKAFEVMTKFASEVPFALEEIERASPLLLTVANDVDELNELLSITGDIAAVSGLSFEATAGQLQRAMAGGISAADLFRERGVKAFLGFDEGVSYTARQTKDLITKMFRDGTTTAKGATEELKDTYQGQVSMMQDAFRELKLVIADAGVFDLTAKAVAKLTELFKDPKTMDAMAQFGRGVTTIGSALGVLFEGFMSMPEWVRNTGLIMAFLGGRQAALVLGGLSAIAAVIGRMTAEMEQLDVVAQKLNADAGIVEEAFNRFGRKSEKPVQDITNAFKDLDDTIETVNGTINRFGIKTTGNGSEGNSVLDAVINKVVTLDDVFSRFDQSQKLVFGKERALSFEYYNRLITRLHKNYRTVNTTIGETGIGIQKITEHMDRNSISSIGMADNLAKIAAETLVAQEKIKEFADGLATSIEDSIVRMVQGLMSFKDVVRSVFQFVAMEMVRMNIARPMASALSSIISGGFGGSVTGNPHLNSGGGGFGDFLKGLFKADGGSVTAGQPYIVGEKGPELFSPSSSGMITPNNQMGGQTINVTYSPQVNALDPRTAQSVIAENAPTIVAAVRQAFNQNGQAVAI